jgi:serine/threonine protein kinase
MQEGTTTTTARTPAAPRTDRLELVKELPRGSVGTVHKARNPQRDRSTVLRQFQVPQWLDDVNELLQRILAEARAASGLDHPNIAKLYTCGYKDFNVFMTAEFVEGQTLKEIMGARTPDLNEVMGWARQLCSGLDHAHARGVYHHFLNPYNIKITPEGAVKILDFGVLRDKNLLSQTPAKKLEDAPYFSPEEVKNKIADRAANMFSLGTILYELYTTRSPFAGKHLGEVDRGISDAMPHPLNVANGRVPEAISRVVLKAMTKNPAERYQSGEQLMQALESAMREPRAVSATPGTGKFPAADATGSFRANGTGSFNASATGSFRANSSGSFSRDAFAAAVNQNPAPAPAATTKTRVPSPQPPTVRRKSVGSSNHWMMVGAVIAVLVGLAAAAMLFQRKPADLATDNDIDIAHGSTQQSSSAPGPFITQEAEGSSAVAAPSARAARSAPAHNSRAGRNQAYAPAAAIAPTTGEMVISAFPLGATVEIEGRPGQWKSPQVIGPLAPGNYKVTVSSPGYAPETRVIQVVAGARTPLDVKLGASKGFLKVAGSPSGASIYIDGKDTGKATPSEFTLDPGMHTIMLRKPGHLDVSTEIKLTAGQGVSYSPGLMVAGRTDNIRIVSGGMGKMFAGSGSSSGMARIEIKSEPKGAQVIVNGTPLQKSTPVEIQVEAGSYEITLQKDGYKPLHESAIVGIEDRVKIDRALSR